MSILYIFLGFFFGLFFNVKMFKDKQKEVIEKIKKMNYVTRKNTIESIKFYQKNEEVM